MFRTNPPLRETTPVSCQLIPFPMVSRIGKIRDVTSKLIEKQSLRHAEYYRKQVTDGLAQQMEKIGVPPEQAASEIHAFWEEVEVELARQNFWLSPDNNSPMGAA